jgi:hypothetical protein
MTTSRETDTPIAIHDDGRLEAVDSFAGATDLVGETVTIATCLFDNTAESITDRTRCTVRMVVYDEAKHGMLFTLEMPDGRLKTFTERHDIRVVHEGRVNCPVCKGTGCQEEDDTATCDNCDGLGVVDAEQ